MVAIKEEELIEAPRVKILPAHADAHVSLSNLTFVNPSAGETHLNNVTSVAPNAEPLPPHLHPETPAMASTSQNDTIIKTEQ